MGYPIEYHHRTNRHGYKAGALQEGLETATGEFVAVFDADFCPPPDFLLRTIHYFADPKVGVVQTRWSYLNRDYNFLTEVEAMLLDGHFILEHGARSRAGYFFNFNGTAGILRKQMIDDAGGWQHDTLTEDSDLSYRAQLKGWRFVYVPGLDCPSELPVEMHGFQVQQSRWAKGLTQVAQEAAAVHSEGGHSQAREGGGVHAPDAQHYLSADDRGFGADAAGDDRAVLHGRLADVLIDLPLIAASFWSISLFYVVAQRELYPKNWKRSILMLPMLMAVGVGLTIINTRAVLEALFGVQTAFARTPKYAIGDRPVNLETKKYRRRSGWLPYARDPGGVLFRYHGGLRHPNPQLFRHAVFASLRGRILVGRFRNLDPRVPDKAQVDEAAEDGAGGSPGQQLSGQERLFSGPNKNEGRLFKPASTLIHSSKDAGPLYELEQHVRRRRRRGGRRCGRRARAG